MMGWMINQILIYRTIYGNYWSLSSNTRRKNHVIFFLKKTKITLSCSLIDNKGVHEIILRKLGNFDIK